MNTDSVNKCAIDTYFNYENYLERLKEGALEKKVYTDNIIQEKSKIILENIKPLISFVAMNKEQLEKTEKSLLKISKTRPGRKLLKQLIKNNINIKIIWDEFQNCCCVKEKK